MKINFDLLYKIKSDELQSSIFDFIAIIELFESKDNYGVANYCQDLNKEFSMFSEWYIDKYGDNCFACAVNFLNDMIDNN